MKMYSEIRLSEINTWGDAEVIKNIIISENLEEEFEELIKELYPNGITFTELNDLLWLDSEYVLSYLGINEEIYY